MVIDPLVPDLCRVVIADDYAALRLLHRRLLERSGAFDVVAEASDGEEAVRLVSEHQPDLVLLDLSMPLLDGLSATRLIRQLAPRTRVAVLSGYDANQLKEEVLGAGVHAYIEKQLRPDRFLEQVLAVARQLK